MKYEILDVDALGRIGKIELENKKLITPNLLPVVHPYLNTVSPKEIKKIGFNSIFTNAYILFKNKEKRNEVLEKKLHQFLDYDGLIATDSGAFQQYMYNKGGIEIKADTIESFQEKIDSDFPVILDLPVQPDDDFLTAKKKVNLSLERAKDNIKRRKKKRSWIGPIHGSMYLDLLKKSTKEMSKLDFDIFAVGGLVKFFLNYQFENILQILLTVKKNIIPSKPLHMFGLGLPQFFSLAVAFGCDLMDSAAYALYAKENRYFTLSTGTRNLNELTEFPCNCPICSNYSPEDLISFPESKKINLLAKHNLYISYSELKTIRQAIRDGNLWELVEERVRTHPRLLEALIFIKDNRSFFERYEKTYKNHGRLFSSLESKFRPLLYRYYHRLQYDYNIPKKTKFMVLLPELDIKGKNSPMVQKWFEHINKNERIPREYIHILFYSKFFGIIPLGLIDTFPMGQYESLEFNDGLDFLYKGIDKKILAYIKNKQNNYQKCAILIPKYFINQFNEKVEFNRKPINNIFQKLKLNLNIPIIKADNIRDIIKWF
ncbi:MAG: tRNA guanosine(15) transglycosylase TgtA [Promethearchaeota archaeon]|nr:MAG: tRNA guanosine(15) transglycosylase TgtA [Candidatus Lokiarchaeota archaeon]